MDDFVQFKAMMLKLKDDLDLVNLSRLCDDTIRVSGVARSSRARSLSIARSFSSTTPSPSISMAMPKRLVARVYGS